MACISNGDPEAVQWRLGEDTTVLSVGLGQVSYIACVNVGGMFNRCSVPHALYLILCTSCSVPHTLYLICLIIIMVVELSKLVAYHVYMFVPNCEESYC